MTDPITDPHQEIVAQAKLVAAVLVACKFDGVMTWIVRDGAIMPVPGLGSGPLWSRPTAPGEQHPRGDTLVAVKIGREHDGIERARIAVLSAGVQTRLHAQIESGQLAEWNADALDVDWMSAAHA